MNDFARPCGFLLGILLCSVPATTRAQTPTSGVGTEVQGRILDAESQDPIDLVETVLIGTAFRTMTDRAGHFLFQGVPSGTYTLRATRAGYRPLLKQGVRVQDGDSLALELPMIRSLVQLEEITVTPGTFSFMESGASARQTMSREDIESVPQLGEDVFRAVNRLPGLSSGDYAAHFSIRGGRHDETLILLDGMELHEPYHLKDFNEGAISIVDAEAIDGVQLMTGGFPAQYGNKRSGVFDITSRTPESDRTRYSVGLSFMNARGMARGPLWNGRGSWLVSARSGFMDLVFGLIHQNQLPSPRYHDVFAKLKVDLNSRNVLSFDVLHAGDRWAFDSEATTGFRDSIKTREDAHNRYGNSYVWTTLKSSLGAGTVVRSMVSASLVTRSRDGSERYVDRPEALYALTNQRDFSTLGFKQDWTHRISDSYVLSHGIDLRRLHDTDDFMNTVYQDPNDPSPDTTGAYPFTTTTGIETRGTRVGLYLSNRLRIVAPLVLEVGGRYDRASYTGDHDFSPRASAAMALGDGRTLRLGWGQYRQIQGIDDVAALNGGGRYFPSELSEQWTGGLEQRFSRGALLRVEAYLKQGSHLRPVYRNWKGGIDTFPETNEDRILVFPRSTAARGVEVYYDHHLNERLALRASYGLASATEEVDRIEDVISPDPLAYAAKHPIVQDQRHAANMDLLYRWRHVWSINGSLAYHSGWPATLERLVPVTNAAGQPDFTVRPAEIYGSRLPSYFRFDVRATRRWTMWGGDMRFFVEMVNLTNHSNVFGYDYFKDLDGGGGIVLQRDDETWFTILPSIGAAWSTHF